MDEYIYPTVSPERKRRFFKYLVIEAKLHKRAKAQQRREDFVKKIDVLRSVAHIAEAKKAEPAPRKDLKELEEKIGRVAAQENIIRELQSENKDIVSKITDIRALIQKIEEDHQQIQVLQNSMKEIERNLKGDLTRPQLGQMNSKLMKLEAQLNKMQQKKEMLTVHEKVVEEKVLEQKPQVDIGQLHKKRVKLLQKISDLKQKKK